MEKKIKKQDFDYLVRREILRAMKLGYTPDEVIESITRVTEHGFDLSSEEEPRSEEKKKKTAQPVSKREYAKPTIAVIECSLEQSWDMCTVLRESLEYEFFPVVLSTMLTEGKKLLQYLGERTVYVTTPFHYNDVHDILKEYGKDPFNLDLLLNKNFLKVLKSLHKYKVVGVLARDEDSLRAATSLVMAYMKDRAKATTKVLTTLLDDKKAMNELIANAEIVVHAPNCRIEAQELLPWGVKKIETVFDIDSDSIKVLKEYLDKIRY